MCHRGPSGGRWRVIEQRPSDPRRPRTLMLSQVPGQLQQRRKRKPRAVAASTSVRVDCLLLLLLRLWAATVSARGLSPARPYWALLLLSVHELQVCKLARSVINLNRISHFCFAVRCDAFRPASGVSADCHAITRMSLPADAKCSLQRGLDVCLVGLQLTQ